MPPVRFIFHLGALQMMNRCAWRAWKRRATPTSTEEEGWQAELYVAEAKHIALFNAATKHTLMVT